MGKANRERRRLKEKARRRGRAAPGAQAPPRASQAPPAPALPPVPPGERATQAAPTERATQARHATQAPPEEQARHLVREAVEALFRGDPQRVARLLSRLGAADDPGWPLAVDLALDEHLRSVLATLWRNGWQPADLFRIAARRGDAAHQEVLRAGVAEDLARYAAPTVDPRWAAQLAEGRSEVWWEPRLTAIQACAEAFGGNRVAFVHAVVDLLKTLTTLPKLELLGPAPGSAVPARVANTHVDERILGRVRAFLAKAESTPYPAEAETFTAAAQALMARHSIDHALLMATGRAPGDEPGGRRIGVDNPYEAAKTTLLTAIASANRCRCVWSKELGFATVVGYPTDLDIVEVLFTSLLVQATAAMTRAGQLSAAGGRARSRTFRQSFLVSYAVRIGERLTQATQEQTDSAAAGPGGGDLLPVLRARSDAVDDAWSRLFPNLRERHIARTVDLDGWSSGRAAADLAMLNPGAALPS